MKKKLFFKKVTALLCCVVMCVTTFVPTVYAWDLTDSDPTVKMNVPDGITLCAPSGTPLTVSETIQSVSKAKYRCLYTGSEVIFYPLDAAGAEGLNGEQIVFCLKSTLCPSLETDSYCIVSKIEDRSNGVWRFTVDVDDYATGECSIKVIAGVEKCKVTFPSGEGYSVWDTNNTLLSGNSFQYEKNKDVTFKVMLQDSNSKQCTVRNMLTNEPIPGNNDGVYTISNIQTDVYVSVTVAPKQFTVTTDLPAEADRKFNYYTTAKTTVDYEGEFWFELSPVAGYNEPKVKVTGAEYSKSPSSDRYTVFDIKDNVTVKVENGDPIGYTVSVPESDAFNVTFDNGTNSFPYGETAAFTVNAKDGYVISSVKAKTEGVADSTEIKPVGGKYSVEVLGNVAITVETKYAVKYESENGEAFNLTRGAASATDGTYYSFGVTTKPGYDPVAVYANETLLTSNNGTYSFTVEGPTTIKVVGGNKIGYTVTLPENPGYTAEFVGEIGTFGYGDTAEFTVGATDGYVISSVKAETEGVAGSTILTLKDGKYSVEVRGNVTITVEMKYVVTYEVTGDVSGVVVDEGESPVAAGTYSFSVTTNPGYEAATVYVNETQRFSNNGIYSFTVSGPTKIRIYCGGKNEYHVILPTVTTGYTVTSNITTPKHGDEVTLTVTPETSNGYEIVSVTATASGRPVALAKGDANTYSFVANADTTVNVAVRKIQYTVTFEPDKEVNTAYTLTDADNASVEHGSSVIFYVNPVTGYGAPKVYVNDKEVIPANGTQYSVKITGTTTIKIVAANKNTYSVTLNRPTGVTYVTGANSVTHDEDFTFSFKLDAAYDKSTPVVKVNSKEVSITKGDDGTYSCIVEDVTENLIVDITGVTLNTYKVTLGSSPAYNLTTTETTNNVPHNSTFSFKLNITEGYYETDAFKVTVNGEEGKVSEPDNDGYYTVTVSADTRIAVEGLELKTFTMTQIGDGETATVVGSKDGILYGSEYTFTVNVKPGYRVDTVAVNNDFIKPDGGKYTVNSVTKNLEIKVETLANTLTINYVCNEDNHVTQETAAFTIVDIENAIASLDSCPIHEFEGWYVGETPATKEYLKSLINTGNATVTLTANFKVRSAEAIVAALVGLDQTQRVFDVDAVDGAKSVRVTFRTGADAKLDACVGDYVKVTAHGTLLLNTYVEFGTDAVMTALKAADETPDGLQKLGEKIEGRNVHYCRTECNMSLEEVNGQEIILRASAKNPETYYAAGWLELTVGENVKVIIVSATNGAPAANAD